MQVFRSWKGLPTGARGASVAMGNFDGIHRGHCSVIDLARRHDKALGIITFEPHPREFFAPQTPPFRLMNAEARANRLARLGVERLFEIPFDTALSQLTANDFAGEVLHAGLGVGHVVVGEDFCFGRGRSGNAQDLMSLGRQFGFDVTIAPLLRSADAVYSSTAIRAALSNGDPALAAGLLGHWHRIEGEVLHGAKRGRELGYPTANMSLSGLHLPRFGVYAVRVDVLEGTHKGTYDGVASLGIRPMFGQNQPNLESHIFDFEGDLYGTHLSVALIEFLRGEEKFASLDALITQMDADSKQAREILARQAQG